MFMKMESCDKPWIMATEPQDPAKQGMHLQLTVQRALVSPYVNKGVVK